MSASHATELAWFFGEAWAEWVIQSNFGQFLARLEAGLPDGEPSPAGPVTAVAHAHRGGAQRVPEPVAHWVGLERRINRRLETIPREARQTLARALAPEECAGTLIREELSPLGKLALVIAHGRPREEVLGVVQGIREGSKVAKATAKRWAVQAEAEVANAMATYEAA